MAAIGIGAAGFVAADRATVRLRPAPVLAATSRCSRRCRSGCPLPIFVDNDANAAVWAEWKYGAARGETHVMMVTLGTGIGGGILVGRTGAARPLRHRGRVRPHAGRPGRAPVRVRQPRLLGAVRQRQRARARGPVDWSTPTPRSRATCSARVGGHAANLTGPLITEAAREGDQTARELLGEIGHWLGVGIANLAAAFDPGTFVIGGGVSAAGDLLLDPARATFARQLTGRGYRPEARIVAAELGNDAGLIGAADLARVAANGEQRRLRWTASCGSRRTTCVTSRTTSTRPPASCGRSSPTCSACRRCRATRSPATGSPSSPGGAA